MPGANVYARSVPRAPILFAAVLVAFSGLLLGNLGPFVAPETGVEANMRLASKILLMVLFALVILVVYFVENAKATGPGNDDVQIERTRAEFRKIAFALMSVIAFAFIAKGITDEADPTYWMYDILAATLAVVVIAMGVSEKYLKTGSTPPYNDLVSKAVPYLMGPLSIIILLIFLLGGRGQ